VTGTDTGVGKTLVGATLARALRRRGRDIGVYKPLQSGGIRRGGVLVATDAQILRDAAGIDDPIDQIAPHRFEEELAPIALLERQGRELSLSGILAGYTRLCEQHDRVLVEGVGGLAVPLFGTVTTVELVRQLGLPLLVVARAGLGTVNHTLLTLSHAERAGLEVLGVVFTRTAAVPDGSEATNPELIARFGGAVRQLGVLPYAAALQDGAVPTAAVLDELAAHIDVAALDRLLG
jgi:dethiobiotin synthetase